ncbi:MAG: SCO family protein [Acidimicrobiales bacterium]
MLRGTEREPLPDVSGAALPDSTADGAEFSFVANDGEVLLVYFGYTSCPDVCPTTLLPTSANALRDLPEELSERVELAMVTIDPRRDTDEVLTGYVQTFVPGAHALRTTDDVVLKSAADALGASYSVVLPPDGGEPEVGHTGFLYAVDSRGRLVVTWAFGTPADDLSHDLAILLDDA